MSIPLTVQGLVDVFTPKVVIAGGAQGVDRPIESVSAAEEEDPTRWMAPHSLLLTSGMILREDPDRGASLVAQLSDEGMSALGLAMAPYWTDVPESMVSAADDLGFPLLRLSGGIAFHTVMRYVFNAQYAGDLYSLRRSVSLQASLAEALTHDDGVRDLIRRLSQYLTADVFLFDWRGSVLESATGDIRSRRLTHEYSQSLWTDYQAHRMSASNRNLFRSMRARVHFCEVRMRGGLERLLMVVVPEDQFLNEFSQDSMTFAKTLLEIDVLAGHNVLGRLRLARTVLLDEFILGGEHPRDVSDRLAHHGISAAEPWRLMAISARDSRSGSHGAAGLHGALADKGVGLVDAYLETLGARFLSTWHSDCLIVLLGLSLGDRLIDTRQFAMGLVQQVSRELHLPELRAGLSEAATGVASVAEAFTHAHQALQSAHRNSAQVVAYEDLGLHFGALHALPAGQLESLEQRIVLPLVKADEERGTSLLETLLAYLAHNRSLVRTAHALFVHRNTLIRRLERIEAILGVDLRETDDLLDICLAVKAHELLEIRESIRRPKTAHLPQGQGQPAGD